MGEPPRPGMKQVMQTSRFKIGKTGSQVCLGSREPAARPSCLSISLKILLVASAITFGFVSSYAQNVVDRKANFRPGTTQLSSKKRSALTSPFVALPTLTKRLPATPFVVPITVDTAGGIIAFQFNILYDPAVLDPSGPNFGCSTSGTLAAGRSPICNVAPGDEGRLQVSVFGSGAMSGTGAVLNVTFLADPSAVSGSVSPLTFEAVSFFDNSGPIAYSPQGGQVTFLGPFTLTAPTVNRMIPSTFEVPITVDEISDLGINSFQFIVLYDPALLVPSGANFGCSSDATLSAGLALLCNVVPGQEGMLRITAFGTTAIAGSGTLLNLTFATATGVTSGSSSTLTFQNVFFFKSSVAVPYLLHSGRVTLYAPTAAAVSLGGRVLTADGSGVLNARVVVSGNSMNEPKMVVTGPFGYYRFDGLQAGETYVVTVNSKRFTFSMPSRVVSLTDDLLDANFIADPSW